MTTRTFTIPADNYSTLEKISNNSNQRLQVVLLATLAGLLNRYTGNSDILIGMPIDFQGVNGNYFNVVAVVRQKVDPNSTFKDLILEINDVVKEALENGNYSFELLATQLLNEQAVDIRSRLDIAFVFNDLRDREFIEDLQCNLIFAFRDCQTHIEGSVEFNSARYHIETIDRIIDGYLSFLNSGISNYRQRLNEIKVAKDVYVAPETPIERRLEKMWEQVLGREKIGRTENFFEIGGHSIKATYLMSRINAELGVRIKLRTIFDNPTLQGLAKVLQTQTREVNDQIPTIPEKEYYDITHAQKRIWILNQLDEERAAYNLNKAFLLEGDLNVQAFIKSFETLVQRHEILRTTIITIEGDPKQKVNKFDSSRFNFEYLDYSSTGISNVNSLRSAEESFTFDLEEGPLVRFKLVKTDERKYVFLLTVHHLICDKWSMDIMISEILKLYTRYSEGKEDALTPLRIQYKDFTYWQNQQLANEKGRIREYWLNQFEEDIAPLNLPIDKERPQVKTSAGSREVFILSKTVAAGLNSLSKDNSSTLYITLLATLNVLLYCYTRKRIVVIGSPIAGRVHADLHDQVGCYVNTLALKNIVEDDTTFTEFIANVRKIVLEAFEFQLYPFDLLIEELGVKRDRSRSPIFDVGFTLQNTNGIVEFETSSLPDVEVSTIDPDELQVKTDLWFHAWEVDNEIAVSISYNKELYLKSTIEKMIADYMTIVGSILQNSDQRITQLVDVFQKNITERDNKMKSEIKDKNLQKFFGTQKKAVNSGDLSKVSLFEDRTMPPVVIIASIDNVILSEWIAGNKAIIEKHLLKYGAVLFRGFGVNSKESFQDAVRSLSHKSMDYIDQTSPRTLISGKLYTSTDHPADQLIHMHNELSYSHDWPMQILFFCLQPSETGGETPIADSRTIIKYLSPERLDKFTSKGIKYVRNMVKGIGLSWQDVYQTDDRSAVEDFCRKNNISFQWKSNDYLRVEWVRPAVRIHPVNKEKVWFNHGYFYNSYNANTALLEITSNSEELPFNTFYGDGSQIEPAAIEEIAKGYDHNKIVFPWIKGDVLLLDNMLMAHGRNPFTGARKILVGMNEPHSRVML